MKAGWETHKLVSICDRVSVGHVGETSSHYSDTGVPFLRTQNIGKQALLLEEYKRITPQFHASLKKSQLQQGDLIISRVVTDVMKCGIVPASLGEANCANVILIRPKPQLLSEFLNYLVKSPNAQDYLLGQRVGSAQQVVNTAVLKAWDVSLPPLEEQKRIVSILDEAFEGLDRARENAEANLKSARELFHRSVERQFEALASIGNIKTIDDIATIKGGKRLPKGDKLTTEKTPFPYISVKDFNDNGSVDTTKIQFLKPTTREAIKNYIIRTEDLYISIAGTIGKTGIVPISLDGANLTENAARMVFKEDVINEYIYYFTLTDDFQNQAGLNTRTAAQPKLALIRLKTITVPMVDGKKQLRIVQKLRSLRRECMVAEASYTAKLQDISDLRQSLLQKAFAGELT